MDMKLALMNCYHAHAKADSYILGFAYKNRTYAIKTDESEMMRYAKLEKASRNQGSNLRLRFNTLDKLDLINKGAFVIGDKDIVNDEKYNKGEKFEKIITEMYGQTWNKDHVPWWEDGDITVDGEKIQIKYEDASVMTEKHMARFN